MRLFDDEWGVDDSPNDPIETTTTILYFSTDELREFKRLSKCGIKTEYGDECQTNGNLADFLLLILKRHYEKDCI
jgi:hypothetical protein